MKQFPPRPPRLPVDQAPVEPTTTLPTGRDAKFIDAVIEFDKTYKNPLNAPPGSPFGLIRSIRCLTGCDFIEARDYCERFVLAYMKRKTPGEDS